MGNYITTNIVPADGAKLLAQDANGNRGIVTADSLVSYGNPYKAYATLALATADLVNIPADSLIWVNNDTTASKNGYYSKTSGTLVQSSFDRVYVAEQRINSAHKYGNLIDRTVPSPIKFGLITSNTLSTASLSMSEAGHKKSWIWVMNGLAGSTSTQADTVDINAAAPGSNITFGLTLRKVEGDSTSQLRATISFYTASNSYISAVLGPLFTPDTAAKTYYVSTVVPENAVKAKIGINYPTITTLTIEHAGHFLVRGSASPSVFYNKTDLLSISSKWSDKKLAILGDSIPANVSGWTVLASQLLLINSADIVNVAVPGNTYVAPGSVGSLCSQADSLVANYTDGAFDLIIVAAGTNDFFAQYPLGDINVEASALLDDVNKGNVAGAVRYVLNTLLAHFTTARVVVIAPIQRYSMSGVATLKQYVDTIIAMSSRLGCPSIDAYSNSGITSYFENNAANGRYLTDGLHPNTNGIARLGKFFANEISKIDPIS